ncbi:KAP family P-loop NTPase fold protein [Psychroflexus aestuariivivens]|uniref:KAP family P-loop NTPase fold protein n=1 Tax=Psychroflexus aestuariivivens TaxID=1795040 RepID=UPI000FD8249A|nr:P-loop NTPase fold protein [Psychroflexus aestuariivivens]
MIIAIIFVFKSTLQSLLFKLAKLFDFESTEFKIGYIILILIGLLGYMFLIDKKYIISRKGHLLAIVLFTTYIIFRNFENGVIYLPESTHLKYIDISVLFFLIHIIQWKITKQNSSIKKADKKDFFINDAVYVDGEIDNELIVQQLITSITNYKPVNSFSIGINAEWGFGKSTFLNRFYTEYSKSNSETIMFWFHIWKNKGDKAVIDNFFKELSTNLKPYSGEIEDNIEKYSEAILNVSPGELKKIISAGKDIFREELSLEEYYQIIQKAIQKIDRQIIIILDDLDRLEAKEILDTYKIIRTLSDFENVIFLAGYDRNYLEKTLGKNKEKYINKIFQVEINLLPFDEGQINEMLLNNIKDVFPYDAIQEGTKDKTKENKKLYNTFNSIFKEKIPWKFLDNTDLSDVFQNKNQFVCSELKLDYKHFIRTHRDLKRFLNEFKFNKNLINTDDIYLPDYVLFRLLTYRYRNLYSIVFENISDIFDNKDYDFINNKMQDSWNDNDGTHYIYDENSKERLFKKLRSHEYSNDDIQIINATLCILFGLKNKEFYKKNEHTISKSYYTNFYLRNGIPNEAYTRSKFKKYWDEGNIEDLINRMEGLSQNTKLQAFNELKIFLFDTSSSISNKNDFYKLIKSLNNFKNSIHSNDFKELEKIIKKLSDKITDLSYEDLKNSLIESNVSIGPIDLLIEDIAVNHERGQRKGLYDNQNINEYNLFPFTIENTKEILLEKLESVLQQNVGYNIHFNYYTLQIDFIAVDHKIILVYEADKVFKAHLNKFFLHFVWGDYLDFKGDPEGFPKEHQTYKPNDFLCQVFCNKEDWDKLKANKTNVAFYKNFRTNGFNNYNSFLQTQKVKNIIVGEDHISKLEKIKKMMDAFIANDCQPLNRTQFEDV